MKLLTKVSDGMLIAVWCSTTRCLSVLYRVLDRMWSLVNKDDQAGTGAAWKLVCVYSV